MIKRPKEINKILNKLSEQGYDVWCAGQCIAAAYVGEDPQDWDIYTDCPQEKLREIFSEGEALGKRVLRLDYTNEIISDDINVADHLEGVIADIVTLQSSMEDQLKVYDFTVEAVAENPHKSPVDPYDGREDIKKKLLKTVKDAGQVFSEEPLKILKALRYAALYDFDLHRSVSEAIAQNAPLLMREDKEEILYEFSIIINGKHAGKALKMIAGLRLLPAFVGEKAANMGKRSADEYETLANNIHKLKHIPLRRMAMFYLCFDRQYKNAWQYLPHDEQDAAYLDDADGLVAEMHFLGNDVAIKKFLYKCGWDKYKFLDKLTKAQAIVFDSSTQKIEGREHILKILLAERQPIFEEDLAIDADDIIEAGITDDLARAEYLLSLMPAVVHQKPKKNDRKELLAMANKFNKNKLSVVVRDVRWLR